LKNFNVLSCNIFVLNARASTEGKSYDSKDSFYEELVHVFHHFPKYRMKILCGNFNANMGGEGIFKPTVGNESLCQNNNDNGVRIVNFATREDLVVKSSMFPHQNIHNYTWNSTIGKTQRLIIY
jgi:hypothetical protein